MATHTRHTYTDTHTKARVCDEASAQKPPSQTQERNIPSSLLRCLLPLRVVFFTWPVSPLAPGYSCTTPCLDNEHDGTCWARLEEERRSRHPAKLLESDSREREGRENWRTREIPDFNGPITHGRTGGRTDGRSSGVSRVDRFLRPLPSFEWTLLRIAGEHSSQPEKEKYLRVHSVRVKLGAASLPV